MSVPVSTSRDDELQQLRNQLEHCLGKLKGYQTLGELFQESRQECAQYKAKNDELARKLESLTRHTYTGTVENPEFVTAYSESPQLVAAGTSGGIHQEAEAVNLVEIGAKSPPEHRSRSTSASASFVQINEDEAALSSNASASLQDTDKMYKLQVLDNAVHSSMVDVGPEISALTRQLQNLGGQSGEVVTRFGVPAGGEAAGDDDEGGGGGGAGQCSVEDLASDLIKAGVSVIKLQKQTRIQQVMISELKSQVVELQTDNSAKQNKINILQKDCDSLRRTVKQMEDRKVRDNEPGTGSNDWVEVEARQTGSTSDVTTVPLAQVEQTRRVAKLNSTINELVSVNRSWDEYCRQLETGHRRQLDILHQKLAEAQRCHDDTGRTDKQKQTEFDRMLLAAKKQREREELAKEEALNELQTEHQKRLELEQKCLDFSRKTAELEQRITELQNARQAECENNLQSIRAPGEPPLSDRESDLYSQVLVLQQQVSLYKEDFDQERQDRETLQSQFEATRKDYDDSIEQVNALRLQFSRITNELSASRNETQQWKQKYQKLSEDLQALQRQARPAVNQASFYQSAPVYRSSSTRSPLPVAVGPPGYGQMTRTLSWTCLRCTFKNPGQRSTCEMCGYSSYPPVSNSVVSRSAAGLQIRQPTGPPATSYRQYQHLDSHSLETDSSKRL
jgi:septal ring factor EnvC (AmiA/AmiB activator)